jgi:hypothetical protein
MKTAQLNQILENAKRDVMAGAVPHKVSKAICDQHGLNWMFIAPIVNGFKK